MGDIKSIDHNLFINIYVSIGVVLKISWTVPNPTVEAPEVSRFMSYNI
jgi:hypothetical protein